MRDAYFVVRALNRLAAMRKMENYFGWLMNVVSSARRVIFSRSMASALNRISTKESSPSCRAIAALVRCASAIKPMNICNSTATAMSCSASPKPFSTDDCFARRRNGFSAPREMGHKAVAFFDKPDAGMWELRSRARVHTTSSVMCWAAVDRLARIADYIGEPERARKWRAKGDAVKNIILERGWSERRSAFVESFDGQHLDAGVLLMDGSRLHRTE